MNLPLSLISDPRSTDVLVVGENSVDLVAAVDEYPSSDSKQQLQDLVELPGGEGATAAVALARLGHRAAYLGRLGDDRFGQFALGRLTEESVDTSACVVIPHAPSRVAVVVVERDTGRRTVLWRRDPRMSIQADDIAEARVASARVLLVGSDDVPAMRAAAGHAQRHDVRRVGDLERVHPGTDALLRQLDIVVMAASFPQAFTGEPAVGAALAAIAALSGAALTCVTLGEDGCLALVDGQELRVPAFRIDAVDTTGAGDLFRAGLIARWLGEPVQPDVRALLTYASAVAALGCRARGAWTSAPRPDEVEALLGGR